jgi:hypothetical protein
LKYVMGGESPRPLDFRRQKPSGFRKKTGFQKWCWKKNSTSPWS